MRFTMSPKRTALISFLKIGLAGDLIVITVAFFMIFL